MGGRLHCDLSRAARLAETLQHISVGALSAASAQRPVQVFTTRVQTAILANKKNNGSLFQNTNAVARHKRASCDRGSSDQSNMTVILNSAKVQTGLSGGLGGRMLEGSTTSHSFLSAALGSLFSFLNGESPMGVRNPTGYPQI